VDGKPQKPSHVLRGNEAIDVLPEAAEPLRAFAEDIPVKVIHADDDLIVIDKPAGMVVHAGAGRHSGTVVNALLHRFPSLSTVGGDERPGVVHRIDKETSGVLVVARNDAAHRKLAAQFASRQVEKIYLALVQGRVAREEGRFDQPITRDPNRRTRMTARLEHGRSALTSFRILRRFERFTYLEVRIGTGRTHQIRVHLSTAGHPIAGDTLYGAVATPHGRFFLHAHRICFRHPATDERVCFESILPADLEEWLSQLS
jgi:23S rRNA pseudouridine1911/1915/1917 synthase